MNISSFYNYNDKVVCETNTPYSSISGEIRIVGIGYNGNKHEVFFTCDGKLLFQTKFISKKIHLAIACGKIYPIQINRGEKPFVYQLE